MLTVSWSKSISGNWFPFHTVNLDNVGTQGVYIIWQGGAQPRVVYVGQGDVKYRLLSHRNRTDITRYSPLYVTWASVPVAQRDGVERYLSDQWRPQVGDAHPDVNPIAVNAPW